MILGRGRPMDDAALSLDLIPPWRARGKASSSDPMEDPNRNILRTGGDARHLCCLKRPPAFQDEHICLWSLRMPLTGKALPLFRGGESTRLICNLSATIWRCGYEERRSPDLRVRIGRKARAREAVLPNKSSAYRE